jgi:hypothetical protein
MFSMPSVPGGTFQSQPLNQFNTSQPTQLPTQPAAYNTHTFSQSQPNVQGWSFTGIEIGMFLQVLMALKTCWMSVMLFVWMASGNKIVIYKQSISLID